VQDAPARLENIVANALLKELHFIQDTQGEKTDLHFLRTKEGKEIDFLISINHQPMYLVEVKTSDDTPAIGFNHFDKMLPNVEKIQLVLNLKREKTLQNGLAIRALIPWLAKINFSKNQ